MKRIFLLLFSIALIIFSCSKDKSTVFKGTIKGLSKGTIYLQQIQDTSLVTIDSVIVNGNNSFHFNFDLKEPDVFYLYLDKKDGTKYNDRLELFLEPGEVKLYTKLEAFEKSAIVTGSKNQTRFEAYKKMIQRFNLHDIELLQRNFEAIKSQDPVWIKNSENKLNELLKRKYLYTVNFALQNKKFEVAPFVTLREIRDANPAYLDTIQKSLSLKIKKSKYGKKLKYLIAEQKAKKQ